MNIQRIVVGPLQTNAYIVADPATKRALVIDPGDEAEKIRAVVSRQKLQVDAVLLTHGHWDHIGAKDAFSAPVYIHPADATMLDSDTSGAKPRPKNQPIGASRRFLNDEASFELGGLLMRVIHTPGHTAGSVCLLIDTVLLSGDTLFCHGVGRTDLPGGSARQMEQSLHKLFSALDGAVRVLPGHGPETTIAAEREP